MTPSVKHAQQTRRAEPAAPRAVPAAPARRPGEAARIGIDVHGLAELRTGITTYVANLVDALGRVAPDESVALYLHTPPEYALPFETVVVPRTRAWTSFRLPLHFALHGAPRVMLYPAHALPVYSPARNVVTIHDLAFELFPDHFPAQARRRWKWLTRHSVPRADHLVAVSAATRDDLVRVMGVPEERITVVHHGYDAAHFRPSPDASVAEVRARYGLHRPYVMAVGTLQSRKNHVSLIRALKLLRDGGTDVDLVVCGTDGWLFEQASRLVGELGLKEHVRFLGYVPHDDLPPLYTGAVAGALVSLYEGFGLPVLESLGCGTPMLVSNVSSLPEVGGDAVLTVDPLDVEAIAHSLRTLICDSEVRSELARRTPGHLKRFSWERTARAMHTLLNQIA